jgi:hypothetical protein
MQNSTSILTKDLVFIFMACLLLSACNDQNNEKHTDLDSKNQPKTPQATLFEEIKPDSSGIHFINHNKENKDFNYYQYEYFYNGGGVAAADFNNDGLIDLFFTANMAPNRLYLAKGAFKFQDISAIANVNSQDRDWATGVTIVDINNEEFQDIFLSRSG